MLSSGLFSNDDWYTSSTLDPETVLKSSFARDIKTKDYVVVLSQIVEDKSWYVATEHGGALRIFVMHSDHIEVHRPSDEQGHGGRPGFSSQKIFRAVYTYTAGDRVMCANTVVSTRLAHVPPASLLSARDFHRSPPFRPPPPPSPRPLQAISTRLSTDPPLPTPPFLPQTTPDPTDGLSCAQVINGLDLGKLTAPFLVPANLTSRSGLVFVVKSFNRGILTVSTRKNGVEYKLPMLLAAGTPLNSNASRFSGTLEEFESQRGCRVGGGKPPSFEPKDELQKVSRPINPRTLTSTRSAPSVPPERGCLCPSRAAPYRYPRSPMHLPCGRGSAGVAR